MKNLLIVALLGLLFCFCSKQVQDNPFFSEYNTPFKTPPFDQIKEKHFLPAYKLGIEQHQKEIDAIVNNTEAPTFKNTIETLEVSGALLSKVDYVFDNLKSANTNDEIQKIAKELSPLLSTHQDNIYLNEKLFSRIKSIYEQKDNLNLTAEQNTLLDRYFKNFVRGGANLNEAQKAELREINKELSLLTLQFSENILKENNEFKLIIEKQTRSGWSNPGYHFYGSGNSTGEWLRWEMGIHLTKTQSYTFFKVFYKTGSSGKNVQRLH